MRKNRRTYDKAFKPGAVCLAVEGVREPEEVERDLGIGKGTVRYDKILAIETCYFITWTFALLS